jgi:hypothetical protein
MVARDDLAMLSGASALGSRPSLDANPTIGQTARMTVKVGISLPDATHARALEHARSAGTTPSGLIDAALKAELTRRELADHMAMLAEADDTQRLHERARARSRALAAWKTGR